MKLGIKKPKKKKTANPKYVGIWIQNRQAVAFMNIFKTNRPSLDVACS